MDIKTPTLTDTIVSNKGRYYGAADRVDLHFAFGKIMVALRRAVARNSPPDCCIQIGSIPVLLTPRTGHPFGCPVLGINYAT